MSEHYQTDELWANWRPERLKQANKTKEVVTSKCQKKGHMSASVHEEMNLVSINHVCNVVLQHL